MSVRLKFSGQCRLTMGCDEQSIDIPDSVLFTELVTKQSITPLLNSDGRINNSILIFVNSKQCVNTRSLMINDGDEITFMSPMSGG